MFVHWPNDIHVSLWPISECVQYEKCNERHNEQSEATFSMEKSETGRKRMRFQNERHKNCVYYGGPFD